MPLQEQMYCSQQICIPPSYPYILRQFAKAAIRTQPNDLLTWATSYFRCLALNIPPPVKARLEYPIPRDYFGITPGWLKTLHTQLQNPQTVSFKVLWDRWMGACLPHPMLVKILCLAGFDNNEAIPWLRFLGVCVAHLTDNLTQTMLMTCEVLTEEPDGGSAMIPATTFLDIYKFLAAIDASQPQQLKNLHFTDDILDLYKKEKEKIIQEITKEQDEQSETVSYVQSVEDKKEEDAISIVSCPSVAKDEYFPIDEYLKILERKQVVGEYVDEGMDLPVVHEEPKTEIQEQNKQDEEQEGEGELVYPEQEQEGEAGERGEGGERVEGGERGEGGEGGDESKVSRAEGEASKQAEDETNQEEQVQEIEQARKAPIVMEDTKKESTDERVKDDDEILKEYIKKQDDEDIKEKEIKDEREVEEQEAVEEGQEPNLGLLPKSSVSLEAAAIQVPPKDAESDSEIELIKQPDDDDKESMKEQEVEHEEVEEEEEKYEIVYVEAVPGIGPPVPEGLVEKVCEYFEEVAHAQYGMLMPRNIRHYTCPPLEVLD